MTDNTQLADRLAALEAELGLVRDQKQREAELFAHPQAPPKLVGWKAESIQMEEEARQLRAEAHAEATRINDEQLTRTAPQRAKLEAEIAAMNTKERTETDRHTHAIATINEERVALRRKLNQLEAPKVTVEQLLAKPEPQRKFAELAARAATRWLPAGMTVDADSFRPAAPRVATRHYGGPRSR